MKRVASMLASLALAATPVVAQQSEAQQPPPPVQAAEESVRTPRENEEMRGDLMMVRKRFSEAIDIYKGILEEEPKNAVLHNKIGIAYHQLMDLNQARRYYQRSIKNDRKYFHAYNNLGTVHYYRKKYGSAIKQYRKALEIREDVPSIHTNLGYAFYMQKKYDEALLAFTRAVELDPLVFERRGTGAGSLLQDRSVTDRSLFYFFLAKTFAMHGNAERCAHYLRKARDEGFKNIAAVEKDPVFTEVLKDPLVQEVLHAAVMPPPK